MILINIGLLANNKEMNYLTIVKKWI